MRNYFFTAMLIGGIGIIVIVIFGYLVDFDLLPKAERARKRLLFWIASIVSIILFIGGIGGMKYLHNKEVDKVKTIVAEKYPDAVDFNANGWKSSVEGIFKSNGTTYEFKETRDIYGKKVLYIGQDSQKSDDSMVIDMDD